MPRQPEIKIVDFSFKKHRQLFQPPAELEPTTTLMYAHPLDICTVPLLNEESLVIKLSLSLYPVDFIVKSNQAQCQRQHRYATHLQTGQSNELPRSIT